MDMKTMIENRAKAWDAAKKFLTDHADANGLLNAEDTATYDRMEKEISDLTDAIKRAERAEEMDKMLNKQMTRPLTAAPEAYKADDKKKEYGKHFENFLRSGGRVINAAMQEGTDSEGGYLVPDEFERTLVESLVEENVFRKYAKVIRTTSGDRLIPVVATHASATWVAEEGSYQQGEPAFTQVALGAHKLGTLAKVSDELLQDSAFDINAFLARDFARAFAAAEETAFITGSGSGQPTGLCDSTYGAGTGVTTASTSAITADEVIDLFYSLKAPYRRNAIFLMNDATVKAVRKLKDGQGTYLWQPAISAGSPDMIMGRPVETSYAMETIAATKKVMAFGDMSYYWIADRQTRSMIVLRELYAASGQIGFRCTERVDGKLVLPEAVKLLVMKAS